MTYYEDRLIKLLGVGGGLAKGYKSNKAIYRIIEQKFGKETPVTTEWNLKFFGDDSFQFWEDLDFGIARGFILSQLDIKPGEPIHHNISLSFFGVERFIKEFPRVKKEIEESLTDFKDYALEVISYYLLPAPYPVNKALLYQIKKKSIEMDKSVKVMFPLSENNIKDLAEIYREKVGIPCTRIVRVEGGYEIELSFDKKLFERYNYLDLKKNPKPKELQERWEEIEKSLHRNFIISYYLQHEILKINEIHERYNQTLEELEKDLHRMHECFEELKNTTEKILEEAKELGSVSLSLTSNSDVTTVKMKVSQDVKEKLSEISYKASYMETFWHILQPGELLPLLAYGREYLKNW